MSSLPGLYSDGGSMAEPSPGFLSDLAELLTKVAARDAVSEAHLVKTVLPSAPGQALAGLAALASNLSDEPLRILCLLLIKRLAPSTLERADPTALEQHGKQIWDLLSDAERDLVNVCLLNRWLFPPAFLVEDVVVDTRSVRVRTSFCSGCNTRSR